MPASLAKVLVLNANCRAHYNRHSLITLGWFGLQVDEPALREGLPLKRTQWSGYLRWAVDAFRLATAVAAPRTQIVTHLCYSEFGDILDAIDGLDGAVRGCNQCSVHLLQS